MYNIGIVTNNPTASDFVDLMQDHYEIFCANSKGIYSATDIKSMASVCNMIIICSDGQAMLNWYDKVMDAGNEELVVCISGDVDDTRAFPEDKRPCVLYIARSVFPFADDGGIDYILIGGDNNSDKAFVRFIMRKCVEDTDFSGTYFNIIGRLTAKYISLGFLDACAVMETHYSYRKCLTELDERKEECGY